ncbi:MAG: ABC transporter substrate-binding protein [Phycisphaerales bacterium]|nr:ABC transporter substrate-binding protein [Phycisphaerales bacterium]
MHVTRRFWIHLAVICMTSLGGCKPSNSDSPESQATRIASLSPAMTMTLQQAGLGKHIVGRSAFCRDVEQLPTVGDLQRVNPEQLVRLTPSHVFIQRPLESVDRGLRQLAQLHGWTIVAQRLVDLHDVAELVRRLPVIFPAAGINEKCDQLMTEIEDALQLVEMTASPSVLIVTPGPSPLAWGGDTYLGQLVEAAGGTNLLPDSEWRSLSLEDIVRLHPDLLLVPADGDPGDLTALQAAVGTDCLRVLSCSAIDVPGPHLATLAPQIRSILSSYTYPP